MTTIEHPFNLLKYNTESGSAQYSGKAPLHPQFPASGAAALLLGFATGMAEGIGRHSFEVTAGVLASPWVWLVLPSAALVVMSATGGGKDRTRSTLLWLASKIEGGN